MHRPRLGHGAAAIAALALALIPGCGASEADVHEAKTSGYATDFAVVYGRTLAAVRKLYPHVIENASAGTIKTKWHPVRIRTDGQNNQQNNTLTPNTTNNQLNPSGGTFQTGNIRRKQYFIRFDIAVVGGRPWRVKLKGQASSWDVGGIPTPLRGAEIPPWLEGRENSLRIAIHERLRDHAVKLKFRKKVEPKAATAKTGGYGDVPKVAARVIAAVHVAAKERDTAALRAAMADEFTWSLGDGPSADVAVAMWQADANLLGELSRVLEAGCRVDDARSLVTCPPDYTEKPSYSGYRVGFKKFGDVWRMTFFVAGE